ncbi:ankyrin repeat domain-containing protein [Flavobacterium magnum]|uniref:Ankyrin repeat domain-containing protein n=1 Tax=Flavobacterium magnum TaxID=2162713 RepID=A0A2S0RJ66_9FLAO|nr:ankyrin repeat domain-containing protein [Flavobacterium magnum]AWA30762.1 ankyrin repeat domain-containing protein [Flavobacterium magnum]
MKKSIICLAMAVLSVTTAAVAAENRVVSNPNTESAAYNGTPLCLAISKGDVDVVKKFIEYGASVNESSNGMTPLMFAARYNQVEIIRLLVENGANLKSKDERGLTALNYAENSKATQAAEYIKSLNNTKK